MKKFVLLNCLITSNTYDPMINVYKLFNIVSKIVTKSCHNLT